jgi:hypothetical protein
MAEVITENAIVGMRHGKCALVYQQCTSFKRLILLVGYTIRPRFIPTMAEVITENAVVGMRRGKCALVYQQCTSLKTPDIVGGLYNYPRASHQQWRKSLPKTPLLV